MSYYDVYFILYEDVCSLHFCDNEIIDLLGINVDDISFEVYDELISLLSDFISKGFNEGFEFALKIFLNNL